MTWWQKHVIFLRSYHVTQNNMTITSNDLESSDNDKEYSPTGSNPSRENAGNERCDLATNDMLV